MNAIAYRLPREMAILSVLDGILSFSAICLVNLAARGKLAASMPAHVSIVSEIMVALCLTIALSAFAITTGLYRSPSVYGQARLVPAGSAAFFALGIVLFLLCAVLTGPEGDEIALTARLLGALSVAFVTARALHTVAVRRSSLARRVLLFGNERDVDALQSRLAGSAGYHFEASGARLDWSWTTLRTMRLWGVVMASPADRCAGVQLLDCKMHGLRVLSAASFQEECLGRIDLDALTLADLLAAGHHAQGRVASFIKRGVDLVLSTVLLLATAPVMLASAIAIKLDSPGSVLYTQKRTGQFGKIFTVFKFRSMRTDAEAGGVPRWAQEQDPRVTRVGRFIRTTRIDELPQLLNIIRGDMSLVGPRPERPHFVKELAHAIPFYQQRHYAKPGLTGWAQVNYPYGASVEDAREKLSYDLYYIKHRSLVLDLAILVDTVRIVLSGEGAR